MTPTKTAGNTLVEILTAVAVGTVLIVTSAATFLAASQSQREMVDEEVVFTRARTLLNRVTSQPFGLPDDANPTVRGVNTLFSLDGEISTVTLQQLANGADDGEWSFVDSQFAVSGEWTVRVDRDLNSNGEIDPGLETTGDCFRIQILFDDRVVLQTSRATDNTE